MPSAGRLWLCVQLNLYLPPRARSLPHLLVSLFLLCTATETTTTQDDRRRGRRETISWMLLALFIQDTENITSPGSDSGSQPAENRKRRMRMANVAWLSTPIKLWHIPTTTFIRQGVYLCGAEQSRGAARAEKGKESHKFSPRHIQRYPPANRLPSRDLSPSRCSLLQLLLLWFVENQPPMNH